MQVEHPVDLGPAIIKTRTHPSLMSHHHFSSLALYLCDASPSDYWSAKTAAISACLHLSEYVFSRAH
jgi:hypothetical protein